MLKLASPLLWSLLAVLGWAQPAAEDADGDPSTLFLTWQQDPCTTMTAQWLVGRAWQPEPAVPPAVSLSFAPVAGEEIEWKVVNGSRHPFGTAELDVCRVELTGLAPGSEYRFRVGASAVEHRFRTAPASAAAEIRFVQGGDVSPSGATVDTCRQAALLDPLFALIGGDIAYGNGVNPQVWVMLLTQWHEHMVTPGGHLIPLVASIGNHETTWMTAGGPAATATREEVAPFFTSLFDGLFPAASHAALDFGDYLSLVLLDSGHTQPMGGAQLEWLETALAERAERDHLMACYHIPSLPSHRPFEGPRSVDARQQWWPAFDRHGMDVVFENHDHTYKRSPLIRDGKIAEGEGVLFLGDGCWGVVPRPVKSAASEWYLASSASRNHFILTTLRGSQRWHAAIDSRGVLFDSYPVPEISATLDGEQQQELGRTYLPMGTPIGVTIDPKLAGAYGQPVVRISGQAWMQADAQGPPLVVRQFRRSATEPGPPFVLDLGAELPAGRYTLSVEGEVTLEDRAIRPFALAQILDFEVLDLTPHPALAQDPGVPGLAASVYLGEWTRLPDFSTLEPDWSGAVDVPATAFLDVKDLFGMLFVGTFEAPASGLYELSTLSDDGSRLWIGEQLVVDNDGLHGAREISGLIVLEKGLHPLRVEFFERLGAQGLRVFMAGPDLEKQPLPADLLRH